MKKFFKYENEDGVGININPSLIRKIKHKYREQDYGQRGNIPFGLFKLYCLNTIDELDRIKNKDEVINRHMEIAIEECKKELNYSLKENMQKALEYIDKLDGILYSVANDTSEKSQEVFDKILDKISSILP